VTPDLQKGTELADRYTLLRSLGAGADTRTWLATDRMTRASVALKILSSDRLSAEFLRKEWQTSIRLMHAHIVRVFEFHSDSNYTFYSMQFIDGADASVLSGAPLAHVLSPMILIANALQYSHGKGIVHRDIKASNILLDSHGAPYLSDFGAAVLENSEAAGGSLVAASPQSVSGEPALPSDDIFAFGGLVYELVAGRSPYSSDNTSDDILHKVPGPLTAASGESVPDGVVDLIASMLEKDAASRPDAETVAVRLVAAGFTGAPAAASYVGANKSSSVEIIEASNTVQARKAFSVSQPVTSTTDKTGISPRTLGVSLAALIALLIGVVFVLPKTVSTDNDATTLDDTPSVTIDTELETVAVEEPKLPDRDGRVVARSETEVVLGQLLSMMSTLERRAVQRWGGVRYKQAQELYAQGDAAYLAHDYATASDKYLETIQVVEPLLDEVDQVFASTFSEAQAALDAANTLDALRLFEMAVAISPSHAAAQAGYARAKNLDDVLGLTERGAAFERDLELAAARQSFEQAVELDPQWKPALDGLQRVNAEINQMAFDARMTEGLFAIADGHYDAARAAFRMAKALKPESREPADGLLQVEQEVRLNQISAYEQQAQQQEDEEAWLLAAATYERLLEIDNNMDFAQEGLQHAQQMSAVHKQLDEFILKPDSLSAPSTMQKATMMIVEITRMPEVGPRLSAQRDELSRLLKRAATPLQVQLISDNATDVSVYKVGRLGSFETHELTLRPGKYVAVGSRPGYRDVRLEFLVGPEQEAKPIVIRCEEAI
jgi:serine/threonine protein kinase/tetratricopeptide (TPR) repeat protein